jgi:hypothetical protein
VTAKERQARSAYNRSMPASRSVIRRLLSAPADAAGSRIAIAGVAGILLTAPLSLQESVAPHPLVSWLLTCCGAVLAVICLRVSWTPRVIVARGAVIVCIVFCAVSGVLGISQTVAALQRSDQQLLCSDDVAPDTVVGGQEVIHGIDPYTSFNLLEAERKLGCPAYSVTPLRSGIFASLLAPPTAAQIEPAAAAAASGHPIGGLLVGFNYPAGTALLGVLGGHGQVLVSPLALLLAGLIIARRAEPSTRRVTILALGAQAGLLAVVGNARVDLVVAALLMVAVSRRRGLAMGIALGVACAVKQTAWFIAPALLVLALREGRVRDPRYQLGALLAFAAVNLPFIIAGPSAWIAGVIAPQIQPEFPLGFGPGAAGQVGSGVVTAFAILMIVAAVAGIAICAAAPRRWAPAGVIVSSLGLWVGPRSLGYYVALLGVIAVSTVIGSNLRESASAGGLCEDGPDVRHGTPRRREESGTNVTAPTPVSAFAARGGVSTCNWNA